MIFNISFLIAFLAISTNEIPNGKTIIANSIEFHDPNNNWHSLQAQLDFIETRPNGDDRHTSIYIDNLRGNFCSFREVKKMHVQRHIVKDSCFYNIDEYQELTDNEIEEYKLTDEQSFFIRNYYLYLWGMPMKLADEGTHISEVAKLTKFDTKEAYEVKVWYDEKIGSDTWFFYFDPENYAMIGYRFYHDVSKNDGEYILLDENELVFGIQIPKTRSWYTHTDSTFLGTDILNSFDDLEHTHF